MSNMSYCRFRNTLKDFREACESIHDDRLSVEEHNARRYLIHEMIDTLADIGAEVNVEDIDQDLMAKR
jgi:hypothetical protein